jgi:hypothetical protein
MLFTLALVVEKKDFVLGSGVVSLGKQHVAMLHSLERREMYRATRMVTTQTVMEIIVCQYVWCSWHNEACRIWKSVSMLMFCEGTITFDFNSSRRVASCGDASCISGIS